MQAEKDEWEQEKEKVRKANCKLDDIIHLNVSGITDGFSVSK